MDPNLFTYLIIAVIMMWIVSLVSIEKKKIVLFLPFFIFAVISCFRGAFVLYSADNIIAFVIMNSTYAILLIWIFFIIKKIKGSNKLTRSNK